MNRLPVGVIGCGYWGPKLVRNFAQCPLTVPTVVCDVNPACLEAIGRTYDHLKQVRSVDQLLKVNVQAVAIATPLATHAALARRCLEAGLHVLVEKPMVATAGEAAALVDLAARRDRVLMVDHTYLFSSAVRRIKAMVDEGALGDLHYLDGIRVNQGGLQRGINVVWDLAAHDLAITDYLLGPQARSISAWGRAHVDKDTEDIAYVSLNCDGGILAHFHVNWLSPVKVRQMTFGGSRRTLIFNDLSSAAPITVYEHGLQHSTPAGERIQLARGGRPSSFHDGWTPRVEGGEPLQAMVQHFAECILEQRAPLSDGRMGLRVVQLLEAATRSIRSQGRWVALANQNGLEKVEVARVRTLA